jgi:hypothetical protein
MFKIKTKDNNSYITNTIKETHSGIMFEANGELLLIAHNKVLTVESFSENQSKFTTVKAADK